MNFINSRYHCTVCEDYDLCFNCYERTGHEHRMEKLMAGASSSLESEVKSESDEQRAESKASAANAAAAGAAAGAGAAQPNKPPIEAYLKTFLHSVHCRNANCTFAKCMQFKRVIAHSKQCQKYKLNQCDYCRQLIALCIYHAKTCKDDPCLVPYCSNIKQRLKQQKALNSQAERRRMMMMNKTLRNSANHNSSSANLSAMQQRTEQPDSPADDGKQSLFHYYYTHISHYYSFIIINCILKMIIIYNHTLS